MLLRRCCKQWMLLVSYFLEKHLARGVALDMPLTLLLVLPLAFLLRWTLQCYEAASEREKRRK